MSYVYDTDGSLPDGKISGVPTTTPSNKRLAASEWNVVTAAVKDLRTALLSISSAAGVVSGSIAGLAAAVSAALASALTQPLVSTFSATGGASQLVRKANFDASSNPAQSSPALANFNKPLEIGGNFYIDADDDSACVYIGALCEKTSGPVVTFLNNYGQGAEVPLLQSMANGDLEIKGSLHIGVLGSEGRVVCDNGPFYSIANSLLLFWNKGVTGNLAEWYSGPGATLVAQLTLDGKMLAAGGLGVGNSAAATTLGSVVKKMEVFDASGNSLGFVPIYNAIT